VEEAAQEAAVVVLEAVAQVAEVEDQTIKNGLP
jgi:hypothetical protein